MINSPYLIGALIAAACSARMATANQLDDLLSAIQTVETGAHPDPAHAVGDNGHSLGWFQISRAYYSDALPFMPAPAAVPPYEVAVADREWSEMIVRAYWWRFAREAYVHGDLETLARVHNGGPNGAHKRATVKYWGRVREVMTRL